MGSRKRMCCEPITCHDNVQAQLQGVAFATSSRQQASVAAGAGRALCMPGLLQGMHSIESPSTPTRLRSANSVRVMLCGSVMASGVDAVVTAAATAAAAADTAAGDALKMLASCASRQVCQASLAEMQSALSAGIYSTPALQVSLLKS